jgi:hypothetical protein
MAAFLVRYARRERWSVRATPETTAHANGLRKYLADDIKSGRLFHAAIAAVRDARHPSVCPSAYVSLQRCHETAYFVNRCRTRRCSPEKDSRSFGTHIPLSLSVTSRYCRCTANTRCISAGVRLRTHLSLSLTTSVFTMFKARLQLCRS